MPAMLALPSCGFIYLDANGEAHWSKTEVPMGMPVFSPAVVTEALEAIYQKGLLDAAQWHKAKALELREAKQWHLAKVHLDAAEAVLELRP